MGSGAALTDVFSGGSALGGDAGIEQAGTDARRKVELHETGSFPKGSPAPGPSTTGTRVTSRDSLRTTASRAARR